MRLLHRAAVVALLAATAAAANAPARAAGVEAPDWLETARKRPAPSFPGKPPVLVLVAEQMVDVSRSETRERVREAVRIMTAEGRAGSRLEAAQAINQDFKLIAGWKVRPDGEVTRYDKKTVVQLDADGSYEFSLSKLNAFSPEEARVGDIVAWEYELKSKPEAYTQYWTFGAPWPILLSRFGIKVPQDWKLRTFMRNHEDLPAGVDDDGYRIWEMRDLAPVKQETSRVPLLDIVPSLMIAYGPDRAEPDSRRFDTWQSVAKWYGGIIAQQVVSDDAVRQTASQLTQGATAPLDRIRAVTRFAQGVRYLNVAPGRSTAEPHPAPQVLRNRFGDCEDKSVLTIALLREIGVEAHAVQVRTSDTGSIVPEFPTPNVFNHTIVAITAPPEVADLPSMLDAGPAGRLILFDPTDSMTGLGDLNTLIQGTRGVLSEETHGGLITLPSLPPEASSRVADMSVRFAEQGGLDVKATITYTGQYAAARRAHYLEVRGDKRKEEYLTYLTSHYGKGEIRSMEVSGVEAPEDALSVSLDLRMPLPGKDLGSLRTMAVRFLVGSRAEPPPESERTTPMRMNAAYQEVDRTTIEVPAGWKVLDPLPTGAHSSAIGDYSLAVRRDGGKLLVERKLTVKAATVPPSDYAPVKKFLDDVARADASGIALEKTSG